MNASSFQDFYFQWPWVLLLLLLIPVFILGYARYQKARWQQALRFSYTSVVEGLKLNPSKGKRLVMPVTVLLLYATLVLAVARPTLTVQVPVRSVEMMLVMDISLSMLAEDLKPNRMMAARDSAVKFVESLPHDVRIGLEFFAGNTYVVTPPVRDHHKVVEYLKSLQLEDLQPRTEIGSALQAALKAMSVPVPKDPKQPGEAPRQTTPQKKQPQRVIILMSDGDSKEGYPWRQAAENAKNQNVTIYTVGIGSPEPTTIVYQNQVLPVTFSEETLKEIANLAQGQYFRVFQEKDFMGVYQKVKDQSIETEERPEDLACWMAVLALGILSGGVFLSLFWVKKLP